MIEPCSIAMFIVIFHSARTYSLSSDCPVLKSTYQGTGQLSFSENSTNTERSIVHCQWLLAVRSGQQLQIEFDHIFIPISLKEYLHNGCRRASLNLWTAGRKHEQIQICYDRKNFLVVGLGQVVIIELRINDPKLSVNFLMKYRLEPRQNQHQLISTSTSSMVLRRASSLCGVSSVNETNYSYGLTSRIVGGRQATPHSYPWQVLLNNQGRFCGASVLNTRWLITAAHCVNGTNPKRIIVEFGVHDRFRIEDSREARTIKQIVTYPFYSGQSSGWTHDLALIQINEPLVFNAFIRPICLPESTDLVNIGGKALVTGWGSTKNTGNNRFLNQVEVLIQSNDKCALDETRSKTSLCAGLCLNGKCDACQGDSGGPMAQFDGNHWKLIGLISWGFNCTGLGVYTKVSYYADWIRKIIENI